MQVGNGLSTKGWQFMLFLFPMRCGLAISEGAQQAAVMQCAVEAVRATPTKSTNQPHTVCVLCACGYMTAVCKYCMPAVR
jgi:hypothetical protein